MSVNDITRWKKRFIHVFITEASKHVGSTLIPKLLHNGHQILNLARSDESAQRLTD